VGLQILRIVKMALICPMRVILDPQSQRLLVIKDTQKQRKFTRRNTDNVLTFFVI